MYQYNNIDGWVRKKAEEGVYARQHKKWCQGFPEQKGEVEESCDTKEACVRHWRAGVPQPKESSETIMLSIGSQTYHLVEEDRKIRNQVLYSEKRKQNKYRCKNKKQYTQKHLKKKGKLMALIKQDYLCSNDSHNKLDSDQYLLYLDGQESDSLKDGEVMHIDIG